MTTIYSISNVDSGKTYIGKTALPLEERWKQHLSNARCNRVKGHLYSALRKSGAERFVYESLCVVPDEQGSFVEMLFIAACQSMETGYNMTVGGEGVGSGKDHPLFGKEVPLSRREKHRSTLKGKKRPAWVGALISAAKKGQPGRIWSAESRRKVADWVSKNRTGINNPRFGKTVTEQTRQRMRDGQRRAMTARAGA
jgi:group I intron endonuclease